MVAVMVAVEEEEKVVVVVDVMVVAVGVHLQARSDGWWLTPVHYFTQKIEKKSKP